MTRMTCINAKANMFSLFFCPIAIHGEIKIKYSSSDPAQLIIPADVQYEEEFKSYFVDDLEHVGK